MRRKESGFIYPVKLSEDKIRGSCERDYAKSLKNVQIKRPVIEV